MAAVETAVLRATWCWKKLLLARAEKQNFKDLDKDEADALGGIKGRFPLRPGGSRTSSSKAA